MTRKLHENEIMEEFYEPKDNIPSRVAKSDYMHKQMMKNYNEKYVNDIGYLDGEPNKTPY